MPELSHIDPPSAALLVMDYQVDTLTKFMTAAQSADAICSQRLDLTLNIIRSTLHLNDTHHSNSGPLTR